MSRNRSRSTEERSDLDWSLDFILELWEIFFRSFLLGSLVVFLFHAFVAG